MEKYKKFLLRLPSTVRKRVISAVLKIAEGRLTGLDLKKLHHEIPVYRCRVGGVGVLFLKTERGNRTLSIKFRGDAYKEM
ncbi:MAG: type II toxin-antitoxin system RelE/ParE family toxin [Candidatus Gracilibacteria bacterium]